MVSVCLPSDPLLQHLPSYLGFSYLGRGVSLQGCSSKAQPLLLTLDEGYLLTAALPDLEHGVAPLGPPVPTQLLLLGRTSLLEKDKSKLQWDITSQQSEWPSSKSLQTINAGEGVEKKELSFLNVSCKSKLEQPLWSNPSAEHMYPEITNGLKASQSPLQCSL